MNVANKNIVIVSIIAIVLVIAACAILIPNDKVEGVTYYGNGGITSDGETAVTYANESVIQNIFSNNDLVFVDWNTQADGEGTSYSVGEAVSYNVSLYAQWSYSVNPFGVDSNGCNYFSFYIDGSILMDCSPVASGSEITISGGSGWTYDSTDGFICTIDGEEYSVIIKVVGTEESPSLSIIDDVPTVILTGVDSNISAYIVCSELISI